jgi:hypothetical protein
MKEIDEINSVKEDDTGIPTVRGGMFSCGAERYRTEFIQCDEIYE